MKYDYQPRPNIEQHHHIRNLIELQEKRSFEREYYRSKEKEERLSTIKESSLVVVTDFYCCKCKEDFKSMSVKEVETDWSNENQYVAFYKAKCFKGHWCIRFITDKLSDPFWMNSKLIALDRGRHYQDILQPSENGYNLLYGRK